MPEMTQGHLGLAKLRQLPQDRAPNQRLSDLFLPRTADSPRRADPAFHSFSHGLPAGSLVVTPPTETF